VNTDIRIDKVGQFYDTAGFVDPFVDGVSETVAKAEQQCSSSQIAVVFTAHSIPTLLASSCRYEDQLRRTAQRIVAEANVSSRWDLAFQSRSGAPQVPWLEPDINDHISALAADGVKYVVVVPIGFVSDHQEIIYDLDFTAANTARSLGIEFARVSTPGTDSRFVTMLRGLIQQHVNGQNTIRCLGALCCPAPQRH
jgi:protoporphyrin/coproporphyrin ferrochelatase